MYEYLSEFKPVHVMELPNSQSEDGFKLWKNEIIKLKKYFRKQFNVSISEENIRKAIKIKNNERKALKEFYELGKLDPVPVTGTDIFKVLNGTTFAFDKEAIPKQLNELVDKIKTEYKNTKNINLNLEF